MILQRMMEQGGKYTISVLNWWASCYINKLKNLEINTMIIIWKRYTLTCDM